MMMIIVVIVQNVPYLIHLLIPQFSKKFLIFPLYQLIYKIKDNSFNLKDNLLNHKDNSLNHKDNSQIIIKDKLVKMTLRPYYLPLLIFLSLGVVVILLL